MVKMSKRSVKNGWKWVKWVKIQKCHIPNVEEASKPTPGATMVPLVSPSMGLYYGQTPKQLHCARTALSAPPISCTYLTFSSAHSAFLLLGPVSKQRCV